MGFWDETKKILDINKEDISKPYCYICPSFGVVVEGFKKIYELSNTKITLLCSDGRKLDILGINLFIKELAHEEISIKGTISSINFI